MSPVLPREERDARLGFHIEDRSGVACVVWAGGGVKPANSVEKALWDALDAVEDERDTARAEVADLMAANRHAVEAKLDALDREAALRGRIEGLARDMERQPSTEIAPVRGMAPIIRALAATPSETEEGR